MAQQTQTRKIRQATPERWQRALQRALFAGVEAKQLAGSGEWIVSSASRPGIAYRTDGISCDCEAAMLGGDPACLHRAAYWYAQGVLELDPEPEPPASAAPVICFRCRGAEAGCPVCQGAGVASLSAMTATAGPVGISSPTLKVIGAGLGRTGTLSLHAVLERLDVLPAQVRDWLTQGQHAGTKISGQWRVAAVAVAELNRRGRLCGPSQRLDPHYWD